MKSGSIVIIGMRIRPSQNTADEYKMMYIPVITLPTGIVGQNKLQIIEMTYQYG